MTRQGHLPRTREHSPYRWGAGTSFSTAVSQSVAGTHEYIAYLDSFSTSFPPSGVTAQPYWIEIFDLSTGTRLAVCGFGTTCSVSFTPSLNGDSLVAFVSANSTAIPPLATQANSAILNTLQLPNIQ